MFPCAGDIVIQKGGAGTNEQGIVLVPAIFGNDSSTVILYVGHHVVDKTDIPASEEWSYVYSDTGSGFLADDEFGNRRKVDKFTIPDQGNVIA